MILNSLFNTILNFVSSMISIIFLPIDALITSLLPTNVLDIISNINNFIDFIIDNVDFAINLTLLPNWVIVVIADYFIFKISVFFSTYVVKIALKWYNYLKG